MVKYISPIKIQSVETEEEEKETDFWQFLQSGEDIAGDKSETLSILLSGMRGHGKTLFVFLWVKHTLARIYELIHGTHIKQDIAQEHPDLLNRMEEAAQHICFCILDVDAEGTEKQIKRLDLLPVCLRSQVHRMMAVSYTSVISAKNILIEVIKEHTEKHPEYPFGRFLLVEGGGKVWKGCRNYWTWKTDSEAVNEVDLRMKRMKKQRRSGGKFQMLYDQGQRDEYAGMNDLLINLLDEFKLSSVEYRFNFIYTVLLKEHILNYGKPNQEIIITEQGRPKLIAPYFDVVARMETRNIQENVGTERKPVMKEKPHWFMTTHPDVGKNRTASWFEFDWTNKGAGEIFAYMKELEETSPFFEIW